MAPSPVWVYFSEDEKTKVVKCSKCTQSFDNPSTTTLYYHLSHVHFINLKKLPPKGRPSSNAMSEREEEERGGARDDACTQALLYMLAKDDMAVRTVERDGFRKFVYTLQPLYHVPSEPTITKKLGLKYEELRAAVGHELAEAEGLSLACDLWTHKETMNAYLGNDFECVEIGARPMPEKKTIENLRVALREICAEWRIDYDRVCAVVTDGGANIKGAVRDEFAGVKHISCVAHRLNMIGHSALHFKVPKLPSEVEPENALREEDIADSLDATTDITLLIQKVKKIVRFFRSSDVATQKLKDQQQHDGKEPHQCLKLVQQVRIRWNSAFYMIDRFLLLSDQVTAVLFKLARERGSTKRKPPPMVSMDELEVLREVRDLLKPLEEATRLVCVGKSVSLGYVIPLVSGLKQKISKFEAATAVGFNLEQELLAQIDKQFQGIELLRAYAAATMLDPRFKKWAFQSPVAASNIVNHLSKSYRMSANSCNRVPGSIVIGSKVKEKLQDDGRALEEAVSVQREATAANSGSLCPYASGVWAGQDTASALPSQLRAYLLSPPLDRREHPNPIKAWESMKTGHEHLYDLAMQYFPVMATSSSAERLFSHAGLIATQLRSRLSPEHLNQLVFLRSVPARFWFPK
ncbi:E3 SUMO-protein ligase ZBED1 [Frankliniella fusca]|uniref:E3 SUMO-protein ligase ZBED1 n=1 Tax=Frankliniella fusca TaxID=407009 RepID=A0AAE1HX67_9NEOP|nr:E3 SUMO-protein ligase ZBED1 [Frankliniella fusca]